MAIFDICEVRCKGSGIVAITQAPVATLHAPMSAVIRDLYQGPDYGLANTYALAAALGLPAFTPAQDPFTTNGSVLFLREVDLESPLSASLSTGDTLALTSFISTTAAVSITTSIGVAAGFSAIASLVSFLSPLLSSTPVVGARGVLALLLLLLLLPLLLALPPRSLSNRTLIFDPLRIELSNSAMARLASSLVRKLTAAK